MRRQEVGSAYAIGDYRHRSNGRSGRNRPLGQRLLRESRRYTLRERATRAPSQDSTRIDLDFGIGRMIKPPPGGMRCGRCGRRP